MKSKIESVALRYRPGNEVFVTVKREKIDGNRRYHNLSYATLNRIEDLSYNKEYVVRLVLFKNSSAIFIKSKPKWAN